MWKAFPKCLLQKYTKEKLRLLSLIALPILRPAELCGNNFWAVALKDCNHHQPSMLSPENDLYHVLKVSAFFIFAF